MKLQFVQSPFNTIRVWMRDNTEIDIIRNSKEFQMFQLISIWGGFDKNERDNDTWIYSWELSMTLGNFIKDRFKHYPDCEINII